MERIGPVLWDIRHIEFLRQSKAAAEIQRVYRGHVGRFRVQIVRMQLKLVMLPMVRLRCVSFGWVDLYCAAPSLTSCV